MAWGFIEKNNWVLRVLSLLLLKMT